MDRKQMVAQRARECFGERLEGVMELVRQDRQGMRGWEEPTHLRSVLRRTIREGSAEEGEAAVAVATTEFGRGAGEPDRGQQREAVGQLLEASAAALEKVSRGQVTELTAEEALGLECVLLLYGRPAVLVSHGRLGTVPPFWSVLEDQRPDIDMVQRGVGRIELFGHPEYEWAGTGFLASDTCLIATRRTAEAFMENRGGQWQFRPGISAWMDYRSEYQGVAGAGYRVRAVIGVHEHYDLALLEVEPPQGNGTAPAPLALAAEPPRPMEGRQVYMIGYPVRDARRDEPELISRIFRDTYNVKRVQPGVIRGTFRFNEVQLLQHDCGPLGQNAGACIVDLETHQAVGINLYGRYMETSTAIPLWVLREDPLVRRAGLTFAEATTQQLEQTTAQVERLARSRYWAEVRDYIAGVYQRAYGY